MSPATTNHYWTLIHTERARLLTMLDTLTTEQWHSPPCVIHGQSNTSPLTSPQQHAPERGPGCAASSPHDSTPTDTTPAASPHT